MTELPPRKWSHLCADLFGTLPSGEYLLVVLDENSKVSRGRNCQIPLSSDCDPDFWQMTKPFRPGVYLSTWRLTMELPFKALSSETLPTIWVFDTSVSCHIGQRLMGSLRGFWEPLEWSPSTAQSSRSLLYFGRSCDVWVMRNKHL